MEINQSSISVIKSDINETMSDKRPPPPREAGIPAKLEAPLSSLTEEKQSSILSMLESFNDEQKVGLKTELDKLKPEAQSMLLEEIGSQIYQLVNHIYQQENKSSNEDSNILDIYV